MKALVALAAAAVFAAGSLSAETKAERGKRVIDEALAALGGEKYLSMENRLETGRAYSFYRDRLTGLSVSRDLHAQSGKACSQRNCVTRTTDVR